MKRDAFIRELRDIARKQGKSFEVFTGKGKGSHYRVTFGGRISTIQSGELTPLMIRTIMKQLGVEER
ncbi:MAG: hypothetical protein AB7P20_18565 [Rhizobiaceae bacterium]